MNVYVLLYVAYLPRLCSCTGGASLKGSQPSVPGNRGARPFPANNQGVQGGPNKPPAVNQLNKVNGQSATLTLTGATPPPRAGSPTLRGSGVDSNQPTRPSSEVTREPTQRNAATLTSQSAFTNKDFLTNGSRSVATKNSAPYEEKAPDDEVMQEEVIQEEDLQNEETEDVIQEEELDNGTEHVSQQHTQYNGSAPNIQRYLDLVNANLPPRKPLRDIEVQEDYPSSEVTKELAQRNAATLKLQSRLEAFVDKDISVLSKYNGEVFQDTEVTEELPLFQETDLNGHTNDSWNLTDISSINTDIKKVQTAPPQTKTTAVVYGLGSGPTTQNPGLQIRVTATNALVA